MSGYRVAVVLWGLLISLPLVAGAFASEPVATVATAESAARAIADAEAARQKAAALGAEWLETRDLVEQAKRAEEQGKWADALGLATRARQQGELATEQAEREVRVWPDRVVR